MQEALFGLGGTILGVLLGWLLSLYSQSLGLRRQRQSEHDWKLREAYAAWHAAHFALFRATNHAFNIVDSAKNAPAGERAQMTAAFATAQDEREAAKIALRREQTALFLLERDESRRGTVTKLTESIPAQPQPLGKGEEYKQLSDACKAADDFMRKLSKLDFLSPP